MRSLLTPAAVLGVMLLAPTTLAQQYPNYPDHFAYVPAERVDDIIRHMGISGRTKGGSNEIYPLDTDLGIRASIGKRGKTPPTDGAEVHGSFGHTWLIVEGGGTVVMGGKLKDPKDLGNGNWSGSGIEGGREIVLKKGDIITCQVGMPHWWKDVPEGVTYLAFHVFPPMKK
ncbi:MAG: hypothetical protein FJW23_09745 [Acidimicrobiia bacterium]|nr:hypothetical protein [Acidimicrobiia bacterium]